MRNYYDIVMGNLRTGDIAKSSDINHIQIHIQDALKELLSDLHDGESYILGSGEDHKNDFVITAAPMLLGRYIDDRHLFEVDKTKYVNINRFDVRQPILMTKTSLYSVIIKMKNTSNRDIPVTFELQDEEGFVLRRNTLTVLGNTEDKEYEVVFDLDYYPTAHNLNHADLKERDGTDIPKKVDEESYDEGFEREHSEEENNKPGFSAGVSRLYFVIKRTNLNAIDLADNEETPINFDPETSLGAYYDETSDHPEKDIYMQVQSSTQYEDRSWNLWFKEVYANDPTYLCTGGTAIIDGEKVQCLDTHISVAGGSSFGNVLTEIELRSDGHLHARNSDASTKTPDENNLDSFQEDVDDRMPMAYFPIASILTYAAYLGYDKEPLIIQDNKQGLLPLSHHERLRRLEKKLDWTADIALPSRIKYTMTDLDWLDTTPNSLTGSPYKGEEDPDNNKKYVITYDSHGNPVVKLTESVVIPIDVTLQETFKDKDGNNIALEESDVKNASYFSDKKNMVHDTKKGTLILEKQKSKTQVNAVATTKKEAKETEFNPWDDKKGNRPADTKFKKHEREYEVTKDKNGKHDKASQYPAMTFYTKTNYKFKKLQIPIHKFKNCSGMKFFIWKRQNPNNKKNTVWLEKKIWTSKIFSLKKAKTKGKYQYLDDGFTLSFGKGGLSLPKGQYVIICLPIPKSGKGSCFVETYEPQDAQDFCIRYEGAANASHFLLKTRYKEIWYNSAKAVAEEENYVTEGSVTSKAIVWSDTNLQKIQTVKAICNNLTTPKGCSYKLEADTGGGWQELDIKKGKATEMNGGSNTFRWRLTFKSNKDGKSSPELKYDSADKNAIQFVLTRESVAYADNDSTAAMGTIDKAMCLTSKAIDGDEVLKKYIGDNNLTQSHFNQFEFGRLWADPSENANLSIDIQASDRCINFINKDDDNNTSSEECYPYWSLNYCDLTLDDFSKESVDYSNYEEAVEYDENNLRFKLDSDHSYNDNDIIVKDLDAEEFKYYANDIDSTDDSSMTFVNKTYDTLNKNQLFAKRTFDKPVDLTKYTGLRFDFKVKSSSANALLNGFGIYISSQEEIPVVNNENNVPSNIRNEPSNLGPILQDSAVLTPVIYPGVSSESYYDGNIIKLIHEYEEDDGDKATDPAYYQYKKEYDSETNQIIWVLQQLHDIRSYKIYPVNTISYADDKKVKDKDYMEFSVRIELDPDSQNLKYAREIGFISLNDEKDKDGNEIYSVTNSENKVYHEPSGEDDSEEAVTTGKDVTLILDKVRAISEDYYPIFNPTQNTFTSSDRNVETFAYDKIPFTKDKEGKTEKFKKYYGSKNIPTNLSKTIISKTSPETAMISIDNTTKPDGERVICYMNNEYGDLSKYKHVALQLASDCYIPKGALKMNLCSEKEGMEPIMSLNIPALNGIYHPYSSKEVINLTQIFKKIKSDESIKSISFSTTNKYADLINQTVDSSKPKVNLFVGKIVLYKAETIPMFHKKIRFKMYLTEDGEILYDKDKKASNDTIGIRKIGAVLDYN
ncbi:MAG: hypothetical protein J6B87_07435 [Clostridia bacterium]|nr:hypothetical protein [Clostridia bacterium]